ARGKLPGCRLAGRPGRQPRGAGGALPGGAGGRRRPGVPAGDRVDPGCATGRPVAVVHTGAATRSIPGGASQLVVAPGTGDERGGAGDPPGGARRPPAPGSARDDTAGDRSAGRAPPGATPAPTRSRSTSCADRGPTGAITGAAAPRGG